MRLQDLVRIFSKHTGLDMWRGRQVLDAFASHIIDALLDGDQVLLPGFGVFYRRGKFVSFHPSSQQRATPLPLVDESPDALAEAAQKVIAAEEQSLRDIQEQLRAYGIRFDISIPAPVRRERPTAVRPVEAGAV